LFNFIKNNTFEKNLHIILKQETDTSIAYFKSQLFKTSLQVCKSFKLVSNIYREGEPIEDGKIYTGPEYAGINFIKQFTELTKSY
jgi:hypothetical protein